MGKIAVIYWSGTGNTEAMAKSIADGINAAGSEAALFNVADFPADTFKDYPKVAFGCPSMGDEVLEEAEFDPFFESIEKYISGKKIALFGSYGWGDGQWMRDWQKRVESDNANLFDDEGLLVHETPDDDDIARCVDFGKRFAAY